jgi:HSP20 family molecular chaperone IbpA
MRSLRKRPFLFGRDLEHFWKTEPDMPHHVFLKLYETEENLVVRAEVPGYTESTSPVSHGGLSSTARRSTRKR